MLLIYVALTSFPSDIPHSMSKYIGKNFVEIGRDRDCWLVRTAARGKAGDPLLEYLIYLCLASSVLRLLDVAVTQQIGHDSRWLMRKNALNLSHKC